MNNNITLPSYAIGKDAYKYIPSICSPLGSKILIIGGETAVKKSFAKINNSIIGSKLSIVAMEIFKGECTYKEIKRVASLSKKLKVDMIFGVGGGKALDTAKGAAHEANIPIITLPTIAATCAAITALSVVYNEDGSFDSFYFFPKPPFHCLIDTQIIAEAPVKYLRAGMGDTLGKHYEALLSSRGDELSHSSLLGVTISNMCGAPILKYGKEALEECEKDLAGKALEYVVLSNIVSTGLVSILVEECYNCAVAHSLFYALEILPHFNEHHLHGDVVAYGVLIQLLIDNQEEEFNKLRSFLTSIGTATTLQEMGVKCDYSLLKPVLDETLMSPDMRHLPYSISEEMLWKAIEKAEYY